MKNLPAVLSIGLMCAYVFGCQQTGSECWPVSEDGQGTGAGGGPIVPGTGGYGDVPPEPQDAANPPQFQCPAEDGEELSGVTCSSPIECSKLCFAASKYCVEYAVHPYKSGLKPGELYDCIDSLPPAKWGGSYTCLYRYENGDACIFSYAAKIGPIHPPAPSPLCVYKSG